MFEPNSRYASIETAEWTAPDGRILHYKRRRFPPPAESQPPLTTAIVAPADRLDLIAARALGDPQAFWRVCDANNVLDPLELTAEAGCVLNIALPQP
jgi:hypothetical protein